MKQIKIVIAFSILILLVYLTSYFFWRNGRIVSFSDCPGIEWEVFDNLSKQIQRNTFENQILRKLDKVDQLKITTMYKYDAIDGFYYRHEKLSDDELRYIQEKFNDIHFKNSKPCVYYISSYEYSSILGKIYAPLIKIDCAINNIGIAME